MALTLDGVPTAATAAEMDALAGVTLGTQAASKVLTNDANGNSGATLVTSLGIGATGSEVAQEAQLAAPTLTQVDASALQTVGRQYTSPNGDVYIYLQGVANVAVSWVVGYIVTATTTSTTTEVATGTKTSIAVALAAVTAGKFGWFQIAGFNTVVKCDGSAGIGPAYIGGTTGGIDSTVVVGDLITGMYITVAESTTCGVYMNYPCSSDASN